MQGISSSFWVRLGHGEVPPSPNLKLAFTKFSSSSTPWRTHAALVICMACSAQQSFSNLGLTAPQALLNSSIVSPGDPTVLFPLRKRLTAQKPITVVGVGSSITAKSGGCTSSLVTGEQDGCCGAICTSRSNGWLRMWFDRLVADFPPATHSQHRLLNAGVPSSSPAIFVECLDTWLPEGGVDLFVIEFVAILVAYEATPTGQARA